MSNKLRLLHTLIAKRFGAVLVSVTVLASVAIALASPASADWTENRGGCSYTCHWYLTSGTCVGPLGVHVPCPLKKKRCAAGYCTQSQQ
jgi:hypothetical protein